MIYDFEEMAKDYAECYKDKTRIKFIEKYLSTFNATNGKKMPFVLFPRQKAFLTTLAENKNVVSIKPRQAGITTLSSGWICAQCVFADYSAPETILCIGNTLTIAQQLITKIRDFLVQVPRWYWGEDYFSTEPKDPKNKRDIFTKNNQNELELFNGCRIVARSSGENAARGISAASILIFDEAAFIENGKAVYASAVATTSSNPNAKIIMVSTPHGHDELYYDIYKNALAKQNNFAVVQFRWYQDPRYNKGLKWYKTDKETLETTWDYDPIVNEDDMSVAYDEERWERLVREGWTPTSGWYTSMCQTFNNDTMKIAQELDVSFQGSADNVVAPIFIEMHEKLNVREPLEDFIDPMVKDTWFWKKPIDGHRYIIGIDPSRGTAHDKTAIEVVDMDGRDENGMPIIEQVAEYNGKKLGDDVGNIAYNYAQLYNNAYAIFDATGGQADAAILTMLSLGYKNFYYEDSVQKTYMIQNSSKQYNGDLTDTLPGFHFQGNRFPVLSNFANMVRNNEIKIRSTRLINELNTWVFKENTGKMDHMAGSWDDLICAMAMVLFVMQFSLNKIESAKHKDKAILNSYMMAGSINVNQKKMLEGKPIVPENGLPFYNNKVFEKYGHNVQGSYLWLFGGYR